MRKLQQNLTSMSQPNPLKALPSWPPVLCLGLWIAFNACVSSLGNPSPPFHHEYLIPTTHTNTNIHTLVHHDQRASTYFSRQGHHFGQPQGHYAEGISFPTEEMTILWFLVQEPKHGSGWDLVKAPTSGDLFLLRREHRETRGAEGSERKGWSPQCPASCGVLPSLCWHTNSPAGWQTEHHSAIN